MFLFIWLINDTFCLNKYVYFLRIIEKKRVCYLDSHLAFRRFVDLNQDLLDRFDLTVDLPKNVDEDESFAVSFSIQSM